MSSDPVTIVCKLLTVEEAFANLCSRLHATSEIDLSDNLMCFLMLFALEKIFSPPSIRHDATSAQVDCEK